MTSGTLTGVAATFLVATIVLLIFALYHDSSGSVLAAAAILFGAAVACWVFAARIQASQKR